MWISYKVRKRKLQFLISRPLFPKKHLLYPSTSTSNTTKQREVFSASPTTGIRAKEKPNHKDTTPTNIGHRSKLYCSAQWPILLFPATYIGRPDDLYCLLRQAISLPHPTHAPHAPSSIERSKLSQLYPPRRRTIGYILCGRAHPIRVNKITYCKAI